MSHLRSFGFRVQLCSAALARRSLGVSGYFFAVTLIDFRIPSSVSMVLAGESSVEIRINDSGFPFPRGKDSDQEFHLRPGALIDAASTNHVEVTSVLIELVC